MFNPSKQDTLRDQANDLEARLNRALEVVQQRVDQLGNVRSELIELKLELITKKDVDVIKRVTAIIALTE